MTAINPVDLASIAQIAKDLNATIYPDGNSPAVEGVYVRNVRIEVWSETEDRKIGTLVEHEDGNYLEFEPASVIESLPLVSNGSIYFPPGVR